MTARFVLDDWSWSVATRFDVEGLSTAIQDLLERLDTARERAECVVKLANYYETSIGSGERLYSVLFETSCTIRLDRDLANRLALALEQLDDLDDSDLGMCEAYFCGNSQVAPSVVYAHHWCSHQHHMAVLPLSLGQVPHGRVAVTVGGSTVDVFFVSKESQHIEFFRSLISLDNADESMFAGLARSAFPALEWADDIWQGLGRFSRPYIAVRHELVNALGGLNDHGAACFQAHYAGDPRDLSRVLSALVGFSTSDENGRTKRHRRSKDDRTRRHRGTSKIFWWHVKLQPHIDRIHFLYEPPPANSPLTTKCCIVVGLFKDHCVLPN